VAELGQETRVAATPVTVKQLLELGYEVVVEKGAGEAASFRDEAYAEAGAVIVGADEAWGSEVVLRINPPAEDEIGRLDDGATLIGMLSPGLRPELVEAASALRFGVLTMSTHRGFGLGHTSIGSGGIPHVSGTSQCLQGLECSSSPTSGTA
jgi:NAD/NADP transhydrogenase alpha subunit